MKENIVTEEKRMEELYRMLEMKRSLDEDIAAQEGEVEMLWRRQCRYESRHNRAEELCGY